MTIRPVSLVPAAISVPLWRVTVQRGVSGRDSLPGVKEDQQ